MRSIPFSFWNPLFFLDRLLGSTGGGEDLPQADISVRRLDWDSDFFGCGIYKIGPFSDPVGFPSRWLRWEQAQTEPRWNAFAEVPSEDPPAFRALGQAGFSLIETRLTYFHALENLPEGGRKARMAGPSDVPALEKTASGAVNDFDKYHADPFFSAGDTDRYLETYIGNCVRGFAEAVFVPDLPSDPASFVALARISGPEADGARPIFRIPLTACLPANKGWHYDLCLQALRYARLKQAAVLVMTTQSTNKAVIHNCEKLGFKLGSCTHIFSKSRS